MFSVCYQGLSRKSLNPLGIRRTYMKCRGTPCGCPANPFSQEFKPIGHPTSLHEMYCPLRVPGEPSPQVFKPIGHLANLHEGLWIIYRPCLLWDLHPQPLISNMHIHRCLTSYLSIQRRLPWINICHDRDSPCLHMVYTRNTR